MKKVFILLSVFLAASCKKDAQSVVQNGDFNVEFLFEQDSCKVYRFRDGGVYVYFSDCRGTIEQNITRNSGKSTHTEKHQTLNIGE